MFIKLSQNYPQLSYKFILFRKFYINKPKPLKMIPGPRPSIPFLGTNWQFNKFLGKYDLKKIHEANEDKYYRFGVIFKDEDKWKNYIVQIFDPNDFEKVLRSQGKFPFRPPNEFVCHYRKNNCSKYPNVGLSNLNGEEWLKNRQLLAPALLTLNTYDILPRLNLINNELVSYLEKQCDSLEVINNVHQIAYRIALESMLSVCLDTRMSCFSSNSNIDGQNLILAIQNLFEAFHELYFGSHLWKIFPTKSYRKYTSSESFIYNTFWNYIEFNLFKLKSNQDHEKSQSLLKTLLNIKGLTEKEVIITVMDFIIGGINTLSTSLCFLLYHFSITPHAQEILYKQIKAVIKSKNETITNNHLAFLPYLKACVKENFRLASIIPSLVRVLPTNVTLSGYDVPAKTPIVINMHVGSKLHSNFEEPEKFKPERWLSSKKNKIHPFLVLPFGFGVRMCIGRRISELILYFIIIKVLLYYELEAVTKKLDIRQSFIIVPNMPVQIKFKKRN